MADTKRYVRDMLGNDADKMMDEATKFCNDQTNCYQCQYTNKKACLWQRVLDERERLTNKAKEGLEDGE